MRAAGVGVRVGIRSLDATYTSQNHPPPPPPPLPLNTTNNDMNNNNPKPSNDKRNTNHSGGRVTSTQAPIRNQGQRQGSQLVQTLLSTTQNTQHASLHSHQTLPQQDLRSAQQQSQLSQETLLSQPSQLSQQSRSQLNLNIIRSPSSPTFGASGRPWEVYLCIDERERAVGETIATKSGVPCMIQTLAVGDYCMVAVNTTGTNEILVLDCVIERKTWSDLASSIMDKRYMEQKHRIKKCPCRNKIYLVEGGHLSDSTVHNMSNSIRGNAVAVRTALAQTFLVDDMRILRTDGFTDTASKLGMLHNAVCARFEQVLKQTNRNGLTPIGPVTASCNTSTASSDRVPLTLQEFNARFRKTKMGATAQEFLARALLQIPRCGRDICEHLALEYGTIRNLREALLSGQEQQIVDMLRNKRVPGRVNPIGPQVAKNIYNLFVKNF